MKVYIGPYPKGRFTTFRLFQAYLTWKYPDKNWWDVEEKDYTKIDRVVEWLHNFTDDVLLAPLTWLFRKEKQKIKVRIDHYDTWSADTTLAHIIHPLLKKMEKHGTPWTDREDAPSDAKYDNKKDAEDYDVGYNEDRWQYILGEMIYAFEMIKEGKWDLEIYDKHGGWTDEAFTERNKIQDRIKNGLRLFGKYYQSLWD